MWVNHRFVPGDDRRGRAAAALGTIVLFVMTVAGCVRTPTAAQREASFRPFVAERVDETDLRDYVAPRTVALFSGPGVGWLRSDDGRRALAVFGPYASGTGSVVSADGYVLTAAHCLIGDPVFAMFEAGSDGRRGATEARVVWRGDAISSSPALDLAVLKIDAREPLAPLAWATDDEVVAGVGVAAAGYHEADDREVVMFAGGHVIYPRLRYRPAKRVRSRAGGAGGGIGTTPAVTTIGHDTPLTYGDSGGPLVTRGGRLVGVNVGWEWPLLRRNRRIALRPAPAWIEQLIAADRARHPRPTTQATSAATQGALAPPLIGE
jgi:S1-C subfamily serine protease